MDLLLDASLVTGVVRCVAMVTCWGGPGPLVVYTVLAIRCSVIVKGPVITFSDVYLMMIKYPKPSVLGAGL